MSRPRLIHNLLHSWMPPRLQIMLIMLRIIALRSNDQLVTNTEKNCRFLNFKELYFPYTAEAYTTFRILDKAINNPISQCDFITLNSFPNHLHSEHQDT